MNPVLACNFMVTLLDSKTSAFTFGASSLAYPTIGFSECTGLEMALEVHEYNQGGGNDGTLKFPTRVKPTNIVLKRGITTDSTLWDWFYSFVQGFGKRRDGTIAVHDASQNELRVWGFRRGIPTKYSGPQFNASQSTVAVETLEIAHEGLYVQSLAGGLAAFAGAIASI